MSQYPAASRGLTRGGLRAMASEDLVSPRGGQRRGDPGVSAGQLDLRHLAHLAGVA
jgi:hypothetical protein